MARKEDLHLCYHVNIYDMRQRARRLSIHTAIVLPAPFSCSLSTLLCFHTEDGMCTCLHHCQRLLLKYAS